MGTVLSCSNSFVNLRVPEIPRLVKSTLWFKVSKVYQVVQVWQSFSSGPLLAKGPRWVKGNGISKMYLNGT